VTIHVRSTKLNGVIVFEPSVYTDARGHFFEMWSSEGYAAYGLPEHFVQDNVSRSQCGAVRGLHLQEPHSQGKLVQVLDGEVFDVAVDVRVGSPTFGRWIGERLSSENHLQMYVPPGFAHGFCVLSASALLSYKCTERYYPEAELSIAWNDPGLAIAWPVDAPILSERDASAPRLSAIASSRLPRWRADADVS
jgi:dTDP-4-dehydrorhamnose 3,5-epimerase